MAKEFLNQYLKLENSIKPDINQHCVVCHEEVGSLSAETGIIECLIRLPCAHLVGSHCIATWLHANNTCPICRREFFSAQARPNPGPGFIIDSDYDSDDLSGDDELPRPYRGPNRMERIDRIICLLELSDAVCQLSRFIGGRCYNLEALNGCSEAARAAMTVFAASHLLGQPVTLDQLAGTVVSTRRGIYDAYRLFYPERHIVSNDREFIPLLREGSERAPTRSNPTPPAWPRPMYADAIWEMMRSRFGTENETILIEVSNEILSTLAEKPHFNDDVLLHVIALSIYLASYLRQIPVSCAEITAATRVSVGDLRATYAAFYPHRDDLESLAFASTWIDNSFLRLLADLPREIP